MKGAAHPESAEDFYENAPCGFFSTLPDGTIVRVNETFLKQTGHTRAALAGRRVQELMTRAGRVFYETHFSPLLLMQGSVKEIACDLLRPGLEPLPVLMNAVLVRDAAGQPELLRFAVFDATDRRRYEAELRRARMRAEHLTAIVKASADAILSIGADGAVQAWNAGAERLFGWSAAEAVEKPALDLLAPSLEEGGAEAIAAELRAGRAVRRETVCTGRHGPVHVSVSLTPHIEPPGELTGVSAILRDISERKLAEEALSRYRVLAEGSRDILIFFRTDGRIVDVNRAAVAAYGYSRDELIGSSFFQIRAEESRAEIPAQLQRLESGPFGFETCHVRKDGSRFPVEASWSRSEFGGERVVLSIIRDISERRLAEARLRESEQQFRLTFENAAIGMAHVGLDGRWLRVNEAISRMTGYSAGEMTQQTFGDITHPDDREAGLLAARRMLADEIGSFAMERRYLRKDGSVMWANLTAALLRDEAGEPLYFISAIEDISERKAAREELERQRHFVERLTHVMPNVLYVFDLGLQRAVWANRQIGAALGFSAEEIFEMGSEFTRLTMHPDDLVNMAAHFSKIGAAADGEIHEIEYRFRHRDGSWRWFHSVDSVFARNAAGRVREIIGTAIDVTGRKHADDALREAKESAEAANRAKDRFLAVLSHELRTPLTPVLMTVAALEHDPDLRADVREDVVMIKRNIELETKLIDDLLDLSRITSGKLELKIEPVDLNAAVRQVCAICRPQILEQSVRLEMQLTDGACFVAADPARLQQMLWNVLRNAIKFTPAKGAIRVSTTRLGPGRCEVRVRDSGIGIPAETLPHIFEAFEQGDARITRQFGGLGLGLAICHALTGLHGGSVRAESEGIGAGATFIIELPASVENHDTTAGHAAPASSAAAPQIRVLIVEDHPDTGRTLARLLRRKGFAVTLAGDIATALATLGGGAFDVLVSDVGLPDGTGHDLMARVRAIYPLPAIAMSGYGMEEDVRRSHEAGFSEHLVKPIDITQLIAAIQRIAG